MRAAALEAPPASSARARSLARAPGEGEGPGGGTSRRGSASDWLAGGMTSRAPFPRRPSPGRRVPQRRAGAERASGGPRGLPAGPRLRGRTQGGWQAGVAGGVRHRLPASWCNSLPSRAEPGQACRSSAIGQAGGGGVASQGVAAGLLCGEKAAAAKMICKEEEDAILEAAARPPPSDQGDSREGPRWGLCSPRRTKQNDSLKITLHSPPLPSQAEQSKDKRLSLAKQHQNNGR